MDDAVDFGALEADEAEHALSSTGAESKNSESAVLADVDDDLSLSGGVFSRP